MHVSSIQQMARKNAAAWPGQLLMYGLYLQDQVGIIIDPSGQPTSSALTFPSGPSALAAVDIFVLAVCTDAIHVFELSSSALIQSLYFPADQRPAPDQQLLANQNATGSRVVVAGFRKVSDEMY